MTRQVPFINRRDELAQAKVLIEDWGNEHIICTEAPGGVGKTRLMQEIRKRALLGFPEEIDQRPQVILLQEFTNSAWSQLFLRGAREMAEGLKIELIEKDAQFNEDQMVEDLRWAIAQDPDAILVRLGTYDRLRPEIQRATEKGIPIIAFDNYLPGFPTRIALDYGEEGRNLAKKMIADLEGQGRIALAWDPSSRMQERRYDILQSVIAGYPEIDPIHYQPGFMGMHMAKAISNQTREIVGRHPNLKAIWVSWDELNRGVVTALHEMDRTDIKVYSFDMCPEDVDLMTQEGSPWVATVATNPRDAGGTVVHIAAQAAVGVRVERRYNLPMTLITQDALNQALSNQAGQAIDFNALPFWSQAQIGNISAETEMPLQILDIIDFDNRSMRIVHHLWSKVVEMLNGHAFAPYRQRLAELRRQLITPDFARSEDELKALNEAFIAGFNTVSKDKRPALFIDTTDTINATREVWDSLVYVLPALKNCAIFISGRNARQIGLAMENTGCQHVDLQTLAPLTDDASRAYLQQKQDVLKLRLDPTLAEKLVRMSHGRPILIDLAVEWQSRAVPMEWLAEADVASLEDEKTTRREEFESQLVSHIAETRRPIDWLILTLAHIYPMDADFLTSLLDEPEDEVNALFEKVREYVFVKLLPDRRISLHDEMRRMVMKYVWPKIDPEGERRRRDSQLAADYLGKEAKKLDNEIDELEKKTKTPKIEQQLSELERTYWSMQLDRVRYALNADWRKGIDVFTEVFDKAPLDVRDALLELVEARRDAAQDRGLYGKDTRYAYEIRLVKQYLRKLRLSDALSLIETLRKDYPHPSYQIDILTRLANYNMQKGSYAKAIQRLEKALELIRSKDDPEMRQWEGRLLNTLGMVNRRMGHLTEASTYYQAALNAYHAADVGDRNQLASIFNNIGYVHSLQGKYQSARSYCEEGLVIRRQLDISQAVGASYATLGEVFRNWGRYHQAMDYYNEALRIFEPQEDRTWLARLYSYRGAVHRLLDELDQAEADLRHSISFDVRTEKPWQHHVLGCVLWNKGQLDKALDLFETSMELAREVHDVRSQVNNLVGAAEVNYFIGEQTSLDDELYQRIQTQAKRLKTLVDKGYNFPHHYGRIQRVLADVAFKRREYDKALKIYANAYSLLGRRLGGYGRRTFTEELDMLAERIEQLGREDPKRALQWCHALREAWSDEMEPIMQRHALIAMCDVHETKIRWNLP